MSRASSGISTIEDAWRVAAEEETRPTGITSDYPNDRCLPNIQSVLTACHVAIRSGAVYETNQLVMFKDLTVEPRDLKFKIIGQTNTIGRTVDVLPSFITLMKIDGIVRTPADIYNSSTKEYTITNYTKTNVPVEIEAEYAAQSIVYRKEENVYTFKFLNGNTIYLRDINSMPLSQLQYKWVAKVDIDLNFFVLKKNGESYTAITNFGYPQAITRSSKAYWPVKNDGTCISGTNDLPSGDTSVDFCLSLDIDDTGDNNLIEVLSIIPIGKTWGQLMQEYEFIYSAIDFSSKNSMSGITATAGSTIDGTFQGQFDLHPASWSDLINAWLICHFGASTNGAVTEYLKNGYSIVYETNTANIPASDNELGIALQFNTRPSWGSI